MEEAVKEENVKDVDVTTPNGQEDSPEEEVATKNLPCQKSQENELEKRELPVEIWDAIFGLLDNNNDLESCLLTSPFFHSILEDRRKYFLFPKVFEQVITKYLNTNDILTCRLTSSHWKTFADNVLQTGDSHYNFFYDDPRRGSVNQLEYLQYSFDDYPSVRFYKNDAPAFERLWRGLSALFYMQTNEATNSINPHYDYETWIRFPSRHLTISDGDIPNLPVANMDNYRIPTFYALSFVGHNIWYLDVWIELREVPITWMSTLNLWFGLTPNLKVLQFKYPFGFDPEKDDDLGSFIESHPFPKFEDLIMLTVQDVPMPVVQFALEANNHIEMLQILRTDFQRELRLGYNLLNQLENMKKLSVTLINFREFEQFEDLTWSKLETLYLDMERCSGIGTKRLFRMLERFQGTLNKLRLKFPIPIQQQETKITENVAILFLPMLKSLKIFIKSATPIDFLAGLPSLQDLHVNVEKGLFDSLFVNKNLKSMPFIKFHDFYDCLDESNIWEILPTLKQLKLTVINEDFDNEQIKYLYKRLDTGVVKRL